MKKLNLDETWRLCLSQWKCLIRRIKAGSHKSVYILKDEWTTRHGFGDKIEEDCFFCEYDEQHTKERYCSSCPGKKIDKDFDCQNEKYHYKYKPIAFYNNLVSLNRKRLANRRPK